MAYTRSTTRRPRLTIETKTPSTHVSDVARLMATDSSCPHSVWFLSRYPSSLRTAANGHGPIDRDPRRTSLIRKTAADLEEQGHRVYPALRNHFEASGSRSGARLKGRPDLIVRDPDGAVTIYDVREGDPGAADELQVRLYMYLLPRSNHGLWRGSRPAGRILYVDGSERRIEAHEIDETFVERVAAVMWQIASGEPARHVPSSEECGRCPLTAEHCSERIETPAGRVTKGRPGGLHNAC